MGINRGNILAALDRADVAARKLRECTRDNADSGPKTCDPYLMDRLALDVINALDDASREVRDA